MEQERWLRGPDFLWGPKDLWPDQQEEEIPDSELEIKKGKTTCATGLELPWVLCCTSSSRNSQTGQGY